MAGLATLIIMLGTFGAAAPAAAEEEEKKLGWSDTAEFSWVATSGNAETETVGFRNTLLGRWEKSAFELKAGGIQASNTKVTKTASGNPNNPTVTEQREKERTVENYFLFGKYGRTITERFFWYVNAGWDRNIPAGIRNRYEGGGGVGNIWVDRERMTWRTDYGVTYIDQENVVPYPPGIPSEFAGLRASSTYKQVFGEKSNTTYGNDTIADYNLDTTEDWRVNMTNWVQVGMSDVLALKVSLQWLYDNLPSLEAIPFTPAPPATVDVPAEDLDTIFTTSLVVNF